MATMTLPGSYPVTYTIAVAAAAADLNKETVWNTGASALGDPHADEPTDHAGVGSYEATNQMLPPIDNDGTVAIAIYGTGNLTVPVAPGASIEVTATNDAEALYYLSQANDKITVTKKTS